MTDHDLETADQPKRSAKPSRPNSVASAERTPPADLRARIARLELTAWLERGLICYLLYLSRDRISELGWALLAILALLFAVFSAVERVRARG